MEAARGDFIPWWAGAGKSQKQEGFTVAFHGSFQHPVHPTPVQCEDGDSVYSSKLRSLGEAANTTTAVVWDVG